MATMFQHTYRGWRIRYTVYLPNGKRRRGEKEAKLKGRAGELFKDASELERVTRKRIVQKEEATYFLNIGLITEAEYTLLAGQAPIKDISWEDLKALWKDYYKKKSRTNTYNAYLTKLRPIIDLLSKNKVSETTAEVLEEYQAQRLRGVKTEDGKWEFNPVMPATINRDFQIIRAMLDLAVKHGALQENPSRKIKDLSEEGGRFPRALYQEELQAFFKALHEHDHLCYGLIVDIVLIALYTGLRMGELLNLPKSNIKFQDRVILVQPHGKGEGYWRPKSKKGSRAIPVHKDLVPILEKYLATEGPYLFGVNTKDGWVPLLTTNTVSHAVKQVMTEAKLASDISLHCLRHSFVSYALKHGVTLPEAQYFAGHEDIETTMNYTHVLPRERSPLENLPSFANLFKEADQPIPTDSPKKPIRRVKNTKGYTTSTSFNSPSKSPSGPNSRGENEQ